MALPRTDADRIADYDAKVVPTTVGLKIAARLTGMKSDFATFANDFVAKQLLVNAALATDNTIFPVTYGFYQAYASQLWHLTKTTGQPALDAIAQIVATNWQTHGLNVAMTVKIALDVFTITVV